MNRWRWRGLGGGAAGVGVTAAALVSPLHEAAERLLAAHMVQHLLLVVVAAPLLALGTPHAVVAWLPSRARRGVNRGIASVRRRLGLHASVPVAITAWLLHVGVLWLWHVPALYEAAIRRPAVHALEHGSLLMTAWVFWAFVLRPRGLRMLGPGGALLYLFGAAAQCTALGALLALTPGRWYAVHASTSGVGLTALEDQLLAGLLMWIPGGLVYMAAALAVLASALGRDSSR